MLPWELLQGNTVHIHRSDIDVLFTVQGVEWVTAAAR